MVVRDARRSGVGRAIVVCLLAGLALAGSARGADGPPGPPRLVVLYVACTLNTRYLEPYNAAVDYTPNLAALARQSVVFNRHMTESAQSGIAFASLFSGAQAVRHGAFWHPVRLDSRLYEISSAFADAGYDTFYWSGHPMTLPQYGYARGVRVTYPRSMRDIDAYTANDPDFAAILDHLRADPSYRAFVQVALTLTHSPYHHNVSRADVARFMEEHPATAAGITAADVDRFIQIYGLNVFGLQWDTRRTIASLGLSAAEARQLSRVIELYYETSVNNLDVHVGKFIASIRDHGLLDESVVAFTSDHGEVIQQENALFHWTHGFQLSLEELEVPWLLFAPGRLRPHRYQRVTRSIDVYPTLAGLSGVRLPPGAPIDGIDLSPAARREVPEPGMRAYFHTPALGSELYDAMRSVEPIARFFPSGDAEWMWVGVRERDMIYQWRNMGGAQWKMRTFDLKSDPNELRDLADLDDPELPLMQERLLEYKARLVKAHERRLTGTNQPSPAETHERLRSLGYIQ